MSDTDTHPRDDYRLIRRLLLVSLVVVIALPIFWLGYTLASARHTREVRSALEGLGCEIEAPELRSTERFLMRVVYGLRHYCALPIGEPTLPIGGIDASLSGLTDSDLVWVKGLFRLETLDLTGTDRTDAGVEQLQQAVPYLQIDR